MGQVGWLVDGVPWLHEDLLAYAETYPGDFDYTPQMIRAMFVDAERAYVSATMIGSCPRELALRNLDPNGYYVPLEYAYGAYRGTVLHEHMEDLESWGGTFAAEVKRSFLRAGTHEPDAIIERPIELDLLLPDGSTVLLKSTPDKVVSSEGLLIDYKSIDEVISTPKASWEAQLSVYRWMLHKTGIEVSRAFIQQISMKRTKRLPIELWDLGTTEAYIFERVPQFAGIFDGTYGVDTTVPENTVLPPPLDFQLDAELAWKCNGRNGKESWCPVSERCKELARRGV